MKWENVKEKNIWQENMKTIENKTVLIGKTIKNVKYFPVNTHPIIGNEGVEILFTDNTLIYFTVSEWGGIEFYDKNNI